jgi:hypothetical protein
MQRQVYLVTIVRFFPCMVQLEYQRASLPRLNLCPSRQLRRCAAALIDSHWSDSAGYRVHCAVLWAVEDRLQPSRHRSDAVLPTAVKRRGHVPQTSWSRCDQDRKPVLLTRLWSITLMKVLATRERKCFSCRWDELCDHD